MKAITFDGEDIEVNRVEIPKITDKQVLIRIKYSGICGTDLSILKGELKTHVPLILGHEITGVIVKVGKNCKTSLLGQKVTTKINTNICGECYFCKRGMNTHCINREAIGVSIDGGWAEYIAIDENNIFILPDNISLEEGVFIEPLASVYRTFETMPIDGEIDKNIAIFGIGKLGLLLLQVAKRMGLATIAISSSNNKLNLAKQFGTDYVINYKQNNVPKVINQLTENIGADIVVDVSGNASAINDIISSCRKRGKIHIKSTLGITPIDLRDLVVNEKSIFTSRCGPFDVAINGIIKDKIMVKPLISRKFKLEMIREALSHIKDNSNTIKVILEC